MMCYNSSQNEKQVPINKFLQVNVTHCHFSVENEHQQFDLFQVNNKQSQLFFWIVLRLEFLKNSD